MAHYRKVSDDEISPYMGIHEVGSPQYHRAQNRKRADVRRRERPETPPEADPVFVLMMIVSVVSIGGMALYTILA